MILPPATSNNGHIRVCLIAASLAAMALVFGTIQWADAGRTRASLVLTTTTTDDDDFDVSYFTLTRTNAKIVAINSAVNESSVADADDLLAYVNALEVEVQWDAWWSCTDWDVCASYWTGFYRTCAGIVPFVNSHAEDLSVANFKDWMNVAPITWCEDDGEEREGVDDDDDVHAPVECYVYDPRPEMLAVGDEIEIAAKLELHGDAEFKLLCDGTAGGSVVTSPSVVLSVWVDRLKGYYLLQVAYGCLFAAPGLLAVLVYLARWGIRAHRKRSRGRSGAPTTTTQRGGKRTPMMAETTARRMTSPRHHAKTPAPRPSAPPATNRHVEIELLTVPPPVATAVLSSTTTTTNSPIVARAVVTRTDSSGRTQIPTPPLIEMVTLVRTELGLAEDLSVAEVARQACVMLEIDNWEGLNLRRQLAECCNTVNRDFFIVV